MSRSACTGGACVEYAWELLNLVKNAKIRDGKSRALGSAREKSPRSRTKRNVPFLWARIDSGVAVTEEENQISPAVEIREQFYCKPCNRRHAPEELDFFAKGTPTR